MVSATQRDNRAAWLPEAKGALAVASAPLGEPGEGQVLIENHAFSIQPLDSKKHNAAYSGAGGIKSYPAILGTNVAGIIVAVGEGVTSVQVGDRVVADTAAYTTGDMSMGTWQKYVISDAKTLAKIGSADFDRAVLIGFPLQTAVSALKEYLGIGVPGSASAEDKVLVWGGGGAVGTCAVQYAKSVGYTVVVTASPKDVARQKAIGASEVIDYRAPDVVDQLRKFGPYKYIFNATGNPESQTAISAVLQPAGGTYATVLPAQNLPENVKGIYGTFSMTVQEEEHTDFRDWWYGDYFPKAVTEGKIEPPRFVKIQGGLAALQQASRDVFEGKIREKVVIDPSEE